MSNLNKETLGYLLAQINYTDCSDGSIREAEFSKLVEWKISPYKTFAEFEEFKSKLNEKIQLEKKQKNDSTESNWKIIISLLFNALFIWIVSSFIVFSFIPKHLIDTGWYYFSAVSLASLVGSILITLRDHIFSRFGWAAKFHFLNRSIETCKRTFLPGFFTIVFIGTFFLPTTNSKPTHVAFICKNKSDSIIIDIPHQYVADILKEGKICRDGLNNDYYFRKPK